MPHQVVPAVLPLGEFRVTPVVDLYEGAELERDTFAGFDLEELPDQEQDLATFDLSGRRSLHLFFGLGKDRVDQSLQSAVVVTGGELHESGPELGVKGPLITGGAELVKRDVVLRDACDPRQSVVLVVRRCCYSRDNGVDPRLVGVRVLG